jgi:hypothetical protein
VLFTNSTMPWTWSICGNLWRVPFYPRIISA